nr:hypothetical protein Iba_chr06cCG14530 [Ipomoea batatas]GMD35115.1 hypothetical protein Iba_scaffold44321CG0010 [Ipomoea batatas]
MQVPITGCGQCDYRPIHCSYISHPKALLLEIWICCSNPGIFRIRVSICNHVVKASSTMYCKQSYLYEFCAACPEVVKPDVLLKPCKQGAYTPQAPKPEHAQQFEA